MPYVRTIPYEGATGQIKEIYDDMLETRGFIPNVQAVSSIRPKIVQTLAAHIGSVMRSESGLTPAEREMIATVVSAINKCQYWTLAHVTALHNADPDSQLAEQVGDDYHNANLTPKQVAMPEFAESLTVDPGNTKGAYVDELKSVGWADEDIVDIVHITCLFNYMDRLADGLGAELDSDRGWEPLLDKLAFKNESTPKEFGKVAKTPEKQATVSGD